MGWGALDAMQHEVRLYKTPSGGSEGQLTEHLRVISTGIFHVLFANND